jgi:hypothetical protein
LHNFPEVGGIYSSSFGDVLVVKVAVDCVDVYDCGTGDLGQMTLAAFQDGLEQGLIERAIGIAEVTTCPVCKGSGLSITHGSDADGAQVPLIMCPACAFCEEL